MVEQFLLGWAVLQWRPTQTDQAWQWNKQNQIVDSGVDSKDKAINIPLWKKWVGEETSLGYGSFLP